MACQSEERVAHNFINLLHHIENVTLESQKTLNFDDQPGKQVAQGGNPLKYELIPPRYLLKRQGYAVCRHCAVSANRACESKNANLFEYCNDHLVQQQCAKQQPSEQMQMQTCAVGGEETKGAHNAINRTVQRETYLTIELKGCLIKAINSVIETIKATRDLQFVSGDLYPKLANDIKLLRDLYERLRTYNTEMHRMKQARESYTNKQEIRNVGAIKFATRMFPTKEKEI
ncbi:unnamed protein product [Toxocara canis]|uniref:Uncharacterized protein n=1 Tax=Toxocara canis TaxID=6265 RepID=A0A183V4T6_TOXCA|nr:unnamed protein product [Toxocara canis]